MTMQKKKWLIRTAAAFVIGVLAFAAWQLIAGKRKNAWIASCNGRLEATEINVAAKMAGRIKTILVDEGDFVKAGQVVAIMDTDVLEAQRRVAEANWHQAMYDAATARGELAQRESEKAADLAIVAQREAELDVAKKSFNRSSILAVEGATSQQKEDDDRAQMLSAAASLKAAHAQVDAAQAAIVTAREQIAAKESAVKAAQATIERVQANINESVLKSPRDGRVEYRVAQPGEVVSNGGTVLTLVDLTDVYMTFFLPTDVAGEVPLGTEVHLVFDAAPQWVIPAYVTFVSAEAQFTPKYVETKEERQKLMFRFKAHIPPAGLRKYITRIKTGVRGVAYIRLDPKKPWPPNLQVKIPPL